MMMVNFAHILVGFSLILILNPVEGDLTEPQDKVVEVHVSSTAAPNEVKKYEALEVVNKSPTKLLKMRGFGTEVHYAKTKDGYYIHVVRIINPEIDRRNLRRPVIFNHGLLESSTIWLINARNVKPLPYDYQCGEITLNQHGSNDTQFLNGPMMLANHGYDVWLMSMRGTDWSLKHQTRSSTDSAFWDYCLDDFALVDVPTVVDYVQRKTGRRKVGYIGHSQATFSIFGLLSTRPSYADVIEPVVAVAPVSFFDHITSVSRLLFLATLTATNKDDHGPFPPDARDIRTAFVKVCKGKTSILAVACNLIEALVSGKGDKWLKGYFNHLPFYTSLKVLRHFGQLIKSRRYQMYDYGEAENKRLYGTKQSPAYNIGRIRSKSLCLISTKSDALSPPKDVERFKRRLTVPLYKDIFIEGDFDHFDLITSSDAKDLVFKPILEIFEEFELSSGSCASSRPSKQVGIGSIGGKWNSDLIGSEFNLELDAAQNEAAEVGNIN